MARVCTTKRDELAAYFKTRPAAGHTLAVLRNIHLIASTFVLMRQHRETADYDSSAKWTRTDALEKIQSVDAAFKSWDAIRDEHEAQNFLVTLLLKERKN